VRVEQRVAAIVTARCGTGLAEIRSALAEIVPVSVLLVGPGTGAQRRRMVKLLNN